MAKMRLWHQNKGKTYKFIDHHVRNYFNISGPIMNVHLYEGTYDESGKFLKDIKIQDILLMETTERKYSDNVYPLHGVYQLEDVDFEMTQYGFHSADMLMMDFHLNDMISKLGRKLSAGDVIEILHVRDDAVEGHDGGINAFYVIQDGKRTGEGYDPNWLPHVFRVRMKKLTDSKEFQDIFDNDMDNDEDGLSSLLSQYDDLLNINNGVLDEAESEVPFKENYDNILYETKHDGHAVADQGMDIDDIESGVSFKNNPVEGEYFIRSDYRPKRMFQYLNGVWEMTDYKFLTKWTRGHQHTDSFINNKNITTNMGQLVTEKTSIINPLKVKKTNAKKPEVD